MTSPVSREEFDDYRENHHAAMNTLAKTSEAMSLKMDRIYDMLAGTFERPGLVHRMATMEAWRQDSPKRWALERGTRIVDAILVAVVLTLGALAIRAFIFQAVQNSGALPYQRDRVALNQEK